MRDGCNEVILKQLLEVSKADLKVASEFPDSAADRMEIMKNIKERLARLNSKDMDTSDLCHLAMTALTNWHSLASTSGLQSMLTKHITSQIHVKELHQYLAATEKTDISDSIAQQLAAARVQVFGVLSNVLIADAIPSEDAVRNEVTVLSKINDMAEVVKEAGGRKKDRAFQLAMKEVPEALMNLRVAFSEADKKVKQKKLQDCADKFLPKVLSGLEEWKKVSSKYHIEDTRSEFSSEFLEALDGMLDYGISCEKDATTMLADMGLQIIKLASHNARGLAEAMKTKAGGHNKEEGAVWYKDVPSRDLAKLPQLLAAFNDVLANAEMSDTLDADINRLSQDICLL